MTREDLELACDQRDRYFALLKDIRKELDRVPWSPDTIQEIAQLLHQGGFKIRGPR